MLVWRLALGCVLSGLALAAQLVCAAPLSQLLGSVHQEGFRTNLSYSIDIGQDQYQVYEAMLFENNEIVDGDLLVIKISKSNDATVMLRDESLIGLSDYPNFSNKEVREKLLLSFAQNIMERDFGGREAFVREAKKIIADGSAHPDLLFVFTEYLKLKK